MTAGLRVDAITAANLPYCAIHQEFVGLAEILRASDLNMPASLYKLVESR